MEQAILIFVAQFTQVMLLGVQSRNIRDGQKMAAVMVSTMLGVLGLYMTTSIARMAVEGGAWTAYVAYIAAGPAGILTAIVLHDFVTKEKVDG